MMENPPDPSTVEIIKKPFALIPSERDRTMALVILLAILLVTGGLPYQFIVKPQMQLNMSMEGLIYRYQKALLVESKREALEAKLRQWRSTQDNTLLLKEPSASLAAAGLQERVKSVVNFHSPDKQRCRINQQKNLTPEQESGFTKIAINVVLQCALEEFQAILYDLETEKPLLILDNLTLRADTSNRDMSGGNSNQPSLLNAQLEISGYINILPDEANSQKAAQ
jgi:general secretion pathway protein M